MFICQTPHEFCSGGTPILSNGLSAKGKIKTHLTGVDANRCYANYLVTKQGYTRVPFSNRTFSKPGEPTLMIPKRHKPDLRKGKRGGKDAKGSRVMPRKSTGGVIVG